jgi:hypothetical protein
MSCYTLVSNIALRLRFFPRQRDRFEDMLRMLIPERSSISAAMVFCIDHAEAAGEICECLAESLCILETPLSKKVSHFTRCVVSTLAPVTGYCERGVVVDQLVLTTRCVDFGVSLCRSLGYSSFRTFSTIARRKCPTHRITGKGNESDFTLVLCYNVVVQPRPGSVQGSSYFFFP